MPLTSLRMSWILFSLLLLFSPWLWRIWQSAPLLMFLLVLLCIAIKKKKIWLTIPLLVLTAVIYFLTTPRASLSQVTPGEQLEITSDLAAYPPITFLPVAHVLEQRREMIVTRHFLSRLFELIDPNYYFFANHPRSPVGADDFAKFPWIFLPLALLGLYRLISAGHKLFLVSFMTCLLIISFTGFSSRLGPWLIFPFVFTLIYQGVRYVFRH